MTSATILKLPIANLEALECLAKNLAKQIKGNETIELISDLGGGKTALVRYLAKALNSQDVVSSPSFTIENIYRCPKFQIHHFDFYRLNQAGICAFELQEALLDPQALVIVEWGQIVEDILPQERLTIKIAMTGETERLFQFQAPPQLLYLLSELK